MGTGSILASHHAPAHVIAASLLHAAYRTGDFGDSKPGLSESKRKLLKGWIGQEVEKYVAGFATLKWVPRTFPLLHKKLDTLSDIERDVILIHLAEHLEHTLDRGPLYYCDVRRNRILKETNRPILVLIAKDLGFPALAEELEQVHRDNSVAEIPEVLRNAGGPISSFVIMPRSYRRRFSVMIHQAIGFGRHHVRRRLSSLDFRTS